MNKEKNLNTHDYNVYSTGILYFSFKFIENVKLKEENQLLQGKFFKNKQSLDIISNLTKEKEHEIDKNNGMLEKAHQFRFQKYNFYFTKKV